MWQKTRSSLLSHLQYEPELFPGLIYRMKAPKVVLLIFVSGKVVLTGGHHFASQHWASSMSRSRSHQSLALENRGRHVPLTE